jgi:nucleotide-binding universal stress UspA family protein
MVIVGSHGRGAMQRLLMGSVSEAVLRRTDRPILIVPTHSRAAQ